MPRLDKRVQRDLRGQDRSHRHGCRHAGLWLSLQRSHQCQAGCAHRNRAHGARRRHSQQDAAGVVAFPQACPESEEVLWARGNCTRARSTRQRAAVPPPHQPPCAFVTSAANVMMVVSTSRPRFAPSPARPAARGRWLRRVVAESCAVHGCAWPTDGSDATPSDNFLPKRYKDTA